MVLRPLQVLDLKEHEHGPVSVVKTTGSGGSSLVVEYIERIKAELQDAEPAPGFEEVRRRLAKIPDRWLPTQLPNAGIADPCPVLL